MELHEGIPHDAFSQALAATSERLEDILQLGVPIPEHIPFDTFGNVHVDTRKYDIYGRKKLQQYGIDKEVCRACAMSAIAIMQQWRELTPVLPQWQLKRELAVPPEEDDYDAPPPWQVCGMCSSWVFFGCSQPRRPGRNTASHAATLLQFWDEWDFRAFMEKRRAARALHADWVSRQAVVGTREYLNVSPLTDSRVADNFRHLAGRTAHRPTHEEFMNVRGAVCHMCTCMQPGVRHACMHAGLCAP